MRDASSTPLAANTIGPSIEHPSDEATVAMQSGDVATIRDAAVHEHSASPVLDADSSRAPEYNCKRPASPSASSERAGKIALM